MKKHSHLKIISSALIIAFVFALTTCSEETGDHGMVWIPEGHFMMGSLSTEPDHQSNEDPQHNVKLTKGFYMSRYLITEEQFSAIMGYTSAYFKGGGNRFPANGVSWYEAIVFCNRLSIQEGLEPVYSISGSTNPEDWGDIPKTPSPQWGAVEMVGDYPHVPNGYRLPTEAEWEYACRAGTTTAYNTNSDEISDNVGWYVVNSSDGYHQVGTKPANAWGLYDMHGNVSEWCWNWNNSYPSSPPEDPIGPISGMNRVIRGGSWNNSKLYLRSAYRSTSDPSSSSNTIGFRVVRP